MQIVMADPNIPVDDPAIPEPNLDDNPYLDLVDYNEEEEEEEDPEEEPFEDPAPQLAPHVHPQEGNMNGWIEPDVVIGGFVDVDGEGDDEADVDVGDNDEDVEEEIDIDGDDEVDDDAELIFPYYVEEGQLPPPPAESSDSELELSEPEDDETDDDAVGDEEDEADGDAVGDEDDEGDVAPEATIGTSTQRPIDMDDFRRGVPAMGESSGVRDVPFVDGLAPWALRRDIDATRVQGRVVETGLGVCQTHVALLESRAKIGDKERELLDLGLGDVERSLSEVFRRLSILESGENAALKKRINSLEIQLGAARAMRDKAERELYEWIGWNRRFYLEMVEKGAVPRMSVEEYESGGRPRKTPKKKDKDDGPSSSSQ